MIRRDIEPSPLAALVVLALLAAVGLASIAGWVAGFIVG